MRRAQTVLATLSLATFVIAAGIASGADQAAAPTASPAATQPATPPVENGSKITKSRSNIQNNREAAAPATPPNATTPPNESTPGAQGVVKTKTKSNQSND
jgi:hypothetical protein